MKSAIVAAALLLASAVVGAEEVQLDVTVNCVPGVPDQLRTAVLALRTAGRLDGPNVITVNGVCQETAAVPIDQFERLTIQAGSAGAAIVSTSIGAAVRIANSRDITLSGLDISGAARAGVNIIQSLEVEMDGCNIHDNGRNGVSAFGTAELVFSGGSSSHNALHGFAIGDSRLAIDSSDVSRNGGNGIVAIDASKVDASGLTVKDNAGFGVIARHASNLNISSSTVTGNALAGIRVSETSHGELFDGNVVRNNGTSTGDAGVYVSENSDVFFDGPNDVSANTGDGIHGSAGAVLSSQGANTISGNGRDGIRLDRGSFEQFFAPDSFADNAGANIRCDSVSWIAGDSGAKNRVECRRVEDIGENRGLPGHTRALREELSRRQ